MNLQTWAGLTYLLSMVSLIAALLLAAKGDWTATGLAIALSVTLFALCQSETRHR
jgi:hypothetical protein